MYSDCCPNMFCLDVIDVDENGQGHGFDRFILDGKEAESLIDSVSKWARPRRHGPLRLPIDRSTQYSIDRVECPLPRDGFPRITSEGAEILCEGLAGNFGRWKWGIGNHPLEMPNEHLSNCWIRATKDGNHFLCTFYHGMHYPQTKKGSVLTPNFSFDKVDMGDIYEPRDSICLQRGDDWWGGLTLLLDDNGKCAT